MAILNEWSLKQTSIIVKNVLHLRSSFDPGGTETILLNLFNYTQNYFRIHLVLLKEGNLTDQLDENRGNRFYRWYRRRFFDIRVFRKLEALIMNEEINIVHTHQFIELFYALSLKMFRPQLKIVHHIHLMFQKKNLVYHMERWLSHHFARIVTVSNSSKEELVKSFGFNADRITVLYNAIHLKKSNVQNLAEANQLLGVPLKSECVNIVMIANFVWGKDHGTFFKAYNLFIRELLPHVNLYFVGRESDISDSLKQKHLLEKDLTDGRIVFSGPIPDATSLLPFFDMVVLSCFSETFNLALIEALSMGKIVLASDIPVFKELGENGKYLHHFKTGDPQDLFRSLQYLVRKLPEAGKNNHASYFQNKYGFDNFVTGLADIYDKINITNS